jgi:hypothetical protein
LKGRPGTNTIAYYSNSLITAEKSFITLAPGNHNGVDGALHQLDGADFSGLVGAGINDEEKAENRFKLEIKTNASASTSAYLYRLIFGATTFSMTTIGITV